MAVSGGSDSTALLVAAVEAGLDVHGLTVDHGLRAGSAEEARDVAALCARLGCGHATRRVEVPAEGNRAAAARDVRYLALAELARAAALPSVLVGHTRDDVAETLLMRLRRGSGIDGLARMAGAWEAQGVRFRRPALAFGREALRDALRRRGIGWIDDPGNDDLASERAATRATMATLGLDAAALAASAEALEEALASLKARAAGSGIAIEDRGDLLLDRTALAAAHPREPDLAPRLLLAGLRWIGGLAHPPRSDARARFVEAALAGRAATLAGCILTREGDTIRLAREPAACAPPGPTDAAWDGRWRLDGPHAPHLRVGALGEAVKDLPWRKTGLPRASLLASPAIRDGDRLVAAPLAGLGAGWTARPRVAFAQVVIGR